MKRRLFNLLAAASLVLCVATAVVWVISYQRQLSYGWLTPDPQGTVSTRGIRERPSWIYVHRGTAGYSTVWEVRCDTRASDLKKLIWDWQFRGVGIRDGPEAEEGGNVGLYRRGYCPLWPIAGVWGMLPAYWLIRVRRCRRHAHRRINGLCFACGYNLTGNVSGVCPECGTAVPPKAQGATAR